MTLATVTVSAEREVVDRDGAPLAGADLPTAGAWERDIGRHWPWVVGALAVACALAGWLAVLQDTDLPMHLRTGEWIVANGRVPFTEPFAWTREGAPFYAYSWLPELVYYAALAGAGAAGLHAIHAGTAILSFLTVIWLGRVARWTPWATLLVALLSFTAWTSFIAAVRPQSWMAFTVPMAWVAAELVVRRRFVPGLLLAMVATALTVNSHLLFPVTALPVLRLLVEPRIAWRQVALFVAANVAGWLATPYAFELPQLLALNLSGNPLVGSSSSITELEPGFHALMHVGVGLKLAALILLLTPVFLPAGALTTRERIWYGLAWTGGLALFALAVRGIVIWLVVALPLLARLVASIPLPTLAITRRVTVAATFIIPLGVVASHLRAANLEPVVNANLGTRQLPVSSAIVVEPLVRWMECEAEAPSDVRAFTVFNFGSYLTWRAPFMRYSIDGRGIFPDSVARAEAYQLATAGPMTLGPWRSADVAIVPLQHATASALDSDSAWLRVRTSIPVDSAFGAAGLWARRGWLDTRESTPPVQDTVRPVRHVAPPGECR
jgi:hypothetical protein